MLFYERGKCPICPLNLYLIKNVKDVAIFHLSYLNSDNFFFIISEAEM